MKNQPKHITIATILIGMLAIILFFADVFSGSLHIPINEVLSILTTQKSSNETWTFIILNFRLPKAVVATIIGAGLSISGLMMQTLFRNPLTEPYILGISSGASLGVALYIMASTAIGGTIFSSVLSSFGLVTAAILGSGIVMIIIVIVSMKVTDAVSLLIVGIMIGSVTSAIVSILQYFSSPDQVHSFIMWTFGSLSGITWNEVNIMIWCFIPAFLYALMLQKNLNAMLLGDNYAHGMGVNIRKMRLSVIIATSVLTGTLTAFTGPIGFIGVAVPHIARYIFKTSDHKQLMPATILIGIDLMLVCDIISQLPGNQSTLPINAVTAIFGAPVVIWVIFSNRHMKGGV